MFPGPLHSSDLVTKILPSRASAPTLIFPPQGEKETYEKNTSTLFTRFDSSGF